MALKDYEFEMKYCWRCSHCKWIPLLFLKSWRFANICPAITRYNLHTYSGGGKVVAALSVYEGRSEITDELLEIIYKCQMDGACNVECHLSNEILEPLEIMRELRAKCVEEGKLIPEHSAMIDGMKKEDNVFGEPKSNRGKWAEGLKVKDINKEKADVLFHTGCMFSYDEELWNVAQGAINLLTKAGVDVGIAGKDESCCGGRAFDLGYRGEAIKYAEDMASRVKASGASKLVTACSDCYGTFKQVYTMIGQKLDVELLHITEYLDQLMKAGKIKPKKAVNMRVTYHDPCHLGRLGEEYIPWKGEWKRVWGKALISEPPKQIRRGTGGVYDPPRDILKSIPGLELVEMERIKEYSWCCGAGGGVREAYEDFSLETAAERIEEAQSTGAETIATSCPWCERNLKDALAKNGKKIRVDNIIELLQQAL